MSCTLLGWNSATAALHSFFQEATKPSSEEAEGNANDHRQSIRRKLSLSDEFGSFGTFGSNEGIMGDRSLWDFNFDSPEEFLQRTREKFYRNNQSPRKSTEQPSPPPPPSPPSPPRQNAFDAVCGGLDHCLGIGEQENGPKRELYSRRHRTDVVPSWEQSPSFEGSDLSGFNTGDFQPQRPGYIVVYKPRHELEENQHLDVLWRRECLESKTRLVRWAGTLEMSAPRSSLSRNTGSNATTSTGTVSAVVTESEVGWITCYSLQNGLTDEACATAMDPVLTHFCQRFGLWANRLSSRGHTVIPSSLENRLLFHPYGSQAAEDELQRRLATGEAPDGAVLDVAEVLQGLPIFFISDLFVQPDLRGSGLGLILLDRACRRIADSYCLVVVFLRDYADERLPLYLGLLGFSYLAPGFLMRRHGNGGRPPRLDEACPFLPAELSASGGKL